MVRHFFAALLLLATSVTSALADRTLVATDDGGRLSVVGSLAHSHNDYAQAAPLDGAIVAGSLGIEADVFPVDNDLLVAHDFEDVRLGKTLRAMYLEPLNAEFDRLGGVDASLPFCGRVRENGLPVILLIDFKRDGERSWELLESQLAEFPGLCRRVTTSTSGEAVVTEGPVIVVVSGDRPIDSISAAPDRRSAIDGRYPEDLGSDRPAHLMPMVSISSYNLAPFAASNEGGLPTVLADFARRAGDAGRVARVWATPDTQGTWGQLSAAGMQLINTDRPSELAEFLREGER